MRRATIMETTVSIYLALGLHHLLWSSPGETILCKGLWKKDLPEDLSWRNGLRIWWCHCSSSDSCCGLGLISGLGTSTCHRHNQKKKKKKRDLSDAVNPTILNILENQASFCVEPLLPSLRTQVAFCRHSLKNGRGSVVLRRARAWAGARFSCLPLPTTSFPDFSCYLFW